MTINLGIDLGGTKIEIIALAESGEELFRKRVKTPQNDYRKTLHAVVDLVDGAVLKLDAPVTVGIGTPGAISPATGLLKNCNSVCLNGRPFKDDLQERLNRPIRISNDANCFALSEATDGAAAGCDVVFGVIVGTGTGGGIVVKGNVLEGPNAIAGEWGHNPLPWPSQTEMPGRLCYCGKCGCIETFLSGPGLQQDHSLETGQQLVVSQIIDDASQGDAKAEATLVRYEDRMARSLAHVINMIDPNVIVLGGGLSNIARLYTSVPLLWAKYVFSDRVDTRLVPPKFGDSSGVRGAAWLWSN